MHGLSQIIYANEQAAARAKAARIKRRYAEAQETITRITRRPTATSNRSK